MPGEPVQELHRGHAPGGTITTRCGLSGDLVSLSVEDAGQGMSEQDLEKACSPFYTTKEKGCAWDWP